MYCNCNFIFNFKYLNYYRYYKRTYLFFNYGIRTDKSLCFSLSSTFKLPVKIVNTKSKTQKDGAL